MSMFERIFEARDIEATREHILRLYRHPKTSPEEREAAAVAHKRLVGTRPDEQAPAKAPEESFMDKFHRKAREHGARMQARLDALAKLTPGTPEHTKMQKDIFG